MARQSKKAGKLKRSDTLSLRINPGMKAGLSIASAYVEKSMSSVIEYALGYLFEKLIISEHDIAEPLRKGLSSAEGAVGVADILKLTWCDDPFLLNLRIYLVLPKGLAERDRLIAETVFASPCFGGEDDVFDGRHLGLVYPLIDVEKARLETELLTSYAEYRIHELQRPDGGLQLGYAEYAELKRKRDEALAAKAMRPAKYHILKSSDQFYTFRLIADNGQILLQGLQSSDRLGVMEDIRTFKSISRDRNVYEVHQGADGSYLVFVVHRMRALAKSQLFTSLAEADEAIEHLINIAKSSQLEKNLE